MVGGSGCGHQTTDARRDGNHQHLGDGNVEAIGIGYADKGNDSSSNRGTGDSHLRGDRGNTTGTLRTDALLKGNITDNGHERVDYMTCTHQHSEKECTKRCQEGNTAWVLA